MSKFERAIHSMFDHIWHCEIEHPVFQDTVGELMTAVIEAYNNLQNQDKPQDTTEQKCGTCYWYSNVGVEVCDREHEPTTSESKACEYYDR